MKNIIYIFIISNLSLLLACNKPKQEQPTIEATPTTILTLTAAQLKNTGIQTCKLRQTALSSILKVSGKIDVPPQNLISVSIPLGGYLKQTTLLPGTPVKKGQTIAVVEDQQFVQLQQDYLTTKARLTFADAEYTRQKDLNESKASSDKVRQQAEMEMNTLKITLSSLAEKLKLINVNPALLTQESISKSVNIQSPITGYVTKVNVNVGKYVNPTDVIFELIDPSDIHLNLKVYEKDLNKIAIGQSLMAYTNHEPTKLHQCQIILIGQELSAERSTEVHCHFKKYDKTLLPGMYMNAEIEVKSHNVFVLPEAAIVNFEGNDYVFKQLKDNQFEIIKVKLGEKEKGLVAIINYEPLLNQTIVEKGAYTLLMKMKNSAEE